jgi:hypothetical protein
MIRRRPIPRSRYDHSPNRKPPQSLRYTLSLDGSYRTYPDGREVCSESPAGRKEYARRVEVMLLRQNFKCCLCGKRLSLAGATFDHARRRGMGASFRDDRESNGGAAHWVCNVEKG